MLSFYKQRVILAIFYRSHLAYLNHGAMHVLQRMAYKWYIQNKH